MKRCFMAVFLAGWTALAGGCKPSTATPPAISVEPPLPTEAQPKLQTIKLYLGAEEMNTEMALKPWQQRCGMMFRTNMAEDSGMIFVMDRPEQTSFWMKNCPLPLSAAYIDPEGTILEIYALQPQDTNSVVATANNILYVLETPQGWFERHGVSTGAVIRTEKGSLSQTFSRRQ